MKIKITFTNAETKEVLKETILNDAEVKATEVDVFDLAEWTENAIKNKARQMVDKIVTESGQGSKFTPITQKHTIVDGLTLESAKDKTERLQAEMEK